MPRTSRVHYDSSDDGASIVSKPWDADLAEQAQNRTEIAWRADVKDLHRVLAQAQSVFLTLMQCNEASLRLAVEIATDPDARKCITWQEGDWYSDNLRRESFKSLVADKLRVIVKQLEIAKQMEKERVGVPAWKRYLGTLPEVPVVPSTPTGSWTSARATGSEPEEEASPFSATTSDLSGSAAEAHHSGKQFLQWMWRKTAEHRDTAERLTEDNDKLAEDNEKLREETKSLRRSLELAQEEVSEVVEKAKEEMAARAGKTEREIQLEKENKCLRGELEGLNKKLQAFLTACCEEGIGEKVMSIMLSVGLGPVWERLYKNAMDSYQRRKALVAESNHLPAEPKHRRGWAEAATRQPAEGCLKELPGLPPREPARRSTGAAPAAASRQLTVDDGQPLGTARSQSTPRAPTTVPHEGALARRRPKRVSTMPTRTTLPLPWLPMASSPREPPLTGR